MINKLSFKLGCFALAAFTATSTMAEPRKLVIASWASPSHVINAQVWPEFIERLEEVSDGELTAEVKLNLAPPPAMADLVLDGAADITFIYHGYNTGRFVTSEIAVLPGAKGNAEANSGAYWRIWEEYLADAGEQDEFKTIAMFTPGLAQLHLAEPIDSIEDIAGRKIRVPGGIGTNIMEGLGGVAIQVSATKVYEMLSSGAVDGVTMNTDGRTSFKLDEVTSVLYELPGGFYGGSFGALMNKEVWESLSPELQAKLDAELFGEETSRLFGGTWARTNTEARDATLAAGNTIVSASDEDIAVISKIQSSVIDETLSLVSTERDLDARAIYQTYIEESEKIMSELAE